MTQLCKRSGKWSCKIVMIASETLMGGLSLNAVSEKSMIPIILPSGLCLSACLHVTRRLAFRDVQSQLQMQWEMQLLDIVRSTDFKTHACKLSLQRMRTGTSFPFDMQNDQCSCHDLCWHSLCEVAGQARGGHRHLWYAPAWSCLYWRNPAELQLLLAL
jgi:hypothetical protein